MTPHGLIAIEELQVGDLVLSQSDHTGEVAYKRVAQTFETPDMPVMDLTVISELGQLETLQVTAEHPFWVEGQGWVEAHQLSEGQTFGSASGSWLKVKGATWTNVRTTVYNVEVEDFHTYFVGEGGVWVHNACGGATKGAGGLTKSVGAAARKGSFTPSPNQLNQAIKRGQAPAGLKRVDVGKVKGEQIHVHFDNGAALNIDGTWKHGSATLTNAQTKWLRGQGWTPPTP